jgi:HPt (histidine-containing phosphotransfer) domain-containing protein
MEKFNFSKEIEKISEGDNQFQTRLIEIIIRQTPEQLMKIEESLNSSNWIEIKNHVHKLQSTLVLLNIPRGIKLAELIRKTAGINIKQTNKEIKELVTICDQLIIELQKYPTI